MRCWIVEKEEHWRPQGTRAKAYADDLRRKLWEAHDRGEGRWQELAHRFGGSRGRGRFLRSGGERGRGSECGNGTGRAPSGERVREATPAGHWNPLTLLGSLTAAGQAYWQR
ncbi:MAG: hypothetical protein HY647_10095 [Acidobacteria bacterium]|nr:hypothetical protein [Acidobacteriota bacterium]